MSRLHRRQRRQPVEKRLLDDVMGIGELARRCGNSSASPSAEWRYRPLHQFGDSASITLTDAREQIDRRLHPWQFSSLTGLTPEALKTDTAVAQDCAEFSGNYATTGRSENTRVDLFSCRAE